MSEPRPYRSDVLTPESSEASDARPVPIESVGPDEEVEKIPKPSGAVNKRPYVSKASDLRPIPIRSEEI